MEKHEKDLVELEEIIVRDAQRVTASSCSKNTLSIQSSYELNQSDDSNSMYVKDSAESI